jgi:alpha-glucosidase
MAAGFGVSGQAFVGADIGGFHGNSNAELFLRWMQYGVLTPFCRNHSEIGNVDQYAWAFGDVVQQHVRTAVQLRYRLMPYLYASFLTASETGAPVQRPLVFDHQYDGTVRDLDDEYLLGPDLLVAPVLEPAMTSRQVYLPAGEWYDWHSGERRPGGSFVIAATPMDRIPLYARAGAVIPMWSEAPASTDGYHPRSVELHVFVPTTDGRWTSVLQEDDGLTFAALEGARYRTELELVRADGRVTLTASVEGAGYPEFAREQFVLVLHGGSATQIEVDGTSRPVADGRVEIANSGVGFTASFAG